MIGKWHNVENNQKKGRQARRYSDRTQALSFQLRTRSQIAQKKHRRPHNPGNGTDSRHDNSDNEQPIRHKQEHATENDDAVNTAADSKNRQPASLWPGQRGTARFFDTKKVMFGEMFEMLQRALMQIGNLEQVRKNVVTVEAKQGIDIEDHGRNRGHKHHVV